MKGKCNKPTVETTPLTSMIEYFTMTDRKKKAPYKLGLDKLLSWSFILVTPILL